MWKFKYYDVDTGVDWVGLQRDCSWFSDMESIPQDPVWHAEGNVQIHTISVTENLMKLKEFKDLNPQLKHIMVVGAIMHDIEKRSTTTEEFKNGRICIVAPKHSDRGEKTARELLYKTFECPYEVREVICKIVKWHGKPLHDCNERTIIKLASQVPIYILAMISKADILGRICLDAEEQLEKIEFFRMLAEEASCLENPKFFLSELAEYTYLSKEDSPLGYVPHDVNRFEVIVMSALPGSGKDTYIKKHLPDYPMISLDDIRKEMKVTHKDKTGNGRVIQEAKLRAKILMRRHNNFIWNGTNITRDLRSKVISLFLEYGGYVKIIHVEVPYKTLIKQNSNREDCIPQDAIDKMIKKWEPPIREESHSLYMIVS